MAHGIQTLTSSTFDETVQAATEPVIVDFWAEWCGPCKMIAPILEEIAVEQQGKVTVAKLNVDEHPDLARRYDVMSIPTLLVFSDGELRKRLIGAKGKGQLLEELNEFPPDRLPLRPGDTGEAVRDLQRRLGAAGFTPGGAEVGRYCPSTESAVRAFQGARGLRVDGRCDEQTWAALVEASWNLGDRLLYHRSPNLRGDDVAELQRRLGRLGFDGGRVDGIFGPLTARALDDFQRNIGLPPDGVCGYETIHALHRLGDRMAGPSIATVREAEQLRRAPRTLAGRRIVVGQLGTIGIVARAVAKALRQTGATVMTLDEPDGSAHAQAANRFGADLYLGLAPTDDAVTIAYYAVPGFESVGGRRLAHLLHERVAPVLSVASEAPHGMRLPVLRETCMPAVLCELGPVRDVVRSTPKVVLGVVSAVTCWVETPEM